MSEPVTFHGGRVTLHAGDCLDILDTLPENSVDAICTDPPYHLTSIVKRFGAANAATAKHGSDGLYARASCGFMGKQWDGGDIAFQPETWAKVLRVLKPGGHMVAFAAPKNQHRMVCAIDDAGFEIRDLLMYMFGVGFPKSLSVSKAIDKAAGAEREIIGKHSRDNLRKNGAGFRNLPGLADEDKGVINLTAPATNAAREWHGWGTALKPAYEPICLARKPLSERTVAANVLRWNCGALNIDACRVALADNDKLQDGLRRDSERMDTGAVDGQWGFKRVDREAGLGRWPANIIHDNSPEVLAGFPETMPASDAVRINRAKTQYGFGDGQEDGRLSKGFADNGGSAARFFASFSQEQSRFHYSGKATSEDRLFSRHPTVKPIALMRWLARLICPPGGTILDPFAGTGTTAHAALLEGFSAILIEREAEYLADIERRMSLVFAGEVERASHRKSESHESLPLFGRTDDADGNEEIQRPQKCKFFVGQDEPSGQSGQSE